MMNLVLRQVMVTLLFPYLMEVRVLFHTHGIALLLNLQQLLLDYLEELTMLLYQMPMDVHLPLQKQLVLEEQSLLTLQQLLINVLQETHSLFQITEQILE